MKRQLLGLCAVLSLSLNAGVTRTIHRWQGVTTTSMVDGQTMVTSSETGSDVTDSKEGESFDPVRWYVDVLPTNDVVSAVVRASANYTGLILDSVRCDSDGFEKKFSVISSSVEFNDSSKVNYTKMDGQSMSTTENASKHTLSSNLCYCTVTCAWQMPVSPEYLYGISSGLRNLAWRDENLINGCYFYLGEFMGVSPSAGSVTIPADLRRVFATCLLGCGNLNTLIVEGSIDNVKNVIFDDCVNLRVLVAGDVATARSIIDACSSICVLELTDGVNAIPPNAFDGCANLKCVRIPSGVTEIGSGAFSRCSRLTDVSFGGDAPEIGDDVFYGTPRRLSVSVPQGSIGWDGSISARLPEDFQGRLIVHSGESMQGVVTSSGISVTVTNAVVHYIQQSLTSEVVVPVTMETGIVNVMTEIEGNNVAIPDSWAKNYPNFTSLFGTDFTAALTKSTGKRDSGGNALMVWHDYVAGTDPTDETSVFTASVTLVGGKPVISYSPVLNEDEAAKRLYRTWGKVKLTDGDWTEITSGTEADYNFFKVTVEMR